MRLLALLVVLAVGAASAAAGEDFEAAFARVVERERLPADGAVHLRELIDAANPHARPPVEISDRMMLPCGPKFVEIVFAPIRDDGRIRSYRVLWCFPPHDRVLVWGTQAAIEHAFATAAEFADRRVRLGDGVSFDDAFSLLAFVRSQPPMPAAADCRLMDDQPRPDRLIMDVGGISREGDDLEVGSYGADCRLRRDGRSWRIVSYRTFVI
jgi:hypothetical protein